MDKSQKTGTVIVKICVDANGQVNSAEFTQLGSTTTDKELVRLAIEGAKKYKFSPSNKSVQCGKISIQFRLI